MTANEAVRIAREVLRAAIEACEAADSPGCVRDLTREKLALKVLEAEGHSCPTCYSAFYLDSETIN